MAAKKNVRMKADPGKIGTGFHGVQVIHRTVPLSCGKCGERHFYVVVEPHGSTASVRAVVCTKCDQGIDVLPDSVLNMTGGITKSNVPGGVNGSVQ